MTDATDRERHDLLALIEAAQREGHSEEKIVAIVDEYLGDESA